MQGSTKKPSPALNRAARRQQKRTKKKNGSLTPPTSHTLTLKNTLHQSDRGQHKARSKSHRSFNGGSRFRGGKR